MTGITPKTYWRVLFVVVLIAAVVWIVAVIYLANKARQERDRLCLVLYALINRSGEQIGRQGSPGYAYYRSHPKERALARAQNTKFLAALPCAPRPEPPPLVTTGDN